MSKIEPEGNGKEKQQLPVKQGAGGLLRELAGRRTAEKRGVFDEFLSSNKNNPTKSRIPHAAGMAVFQTNGLWASTKTYFEYEVQGRKQRFPRTVSGQQDLFKRLYDEDAISLHGESRREAETAALGYFLQDIESIEGVKRDRLGESGGASKK